MERKRLKVELICIFLTVKDFEHSPPHILQLLLVVVTVVILLCCVCVC